MNATYQTMKSEYQMLGLALRTMREHAAMGDWSGFETIDDLVDAIRATERRMFEIVAAA